MKSKRFTKSQVIDFCIANDLFDVQPFTGGINKGKLSVFFCDIEVLGELQKFANILLNEINEGNNDK